MTTGVSNLQPLTFNPADLRAIGLSAEEYQLILHKLDRQPNPIELGMLGAMWSEHCGYKNSRPLLRRLPTTGPRVVQGPGENAGAVDIGDGLLVVLKMESHNHPSAVEPHQGAATGVGGILRDIFTMGARPIALLDSLRFGPPGQARNNYLISGVVEGIADYGNCVGVPTVGGEVHFDPSYTSNPLVNVMCVGVAQREGLMRARASGAGNPVILVGAETGRDGIHGASFASIEDPEQSHRGVVQVGNPFLEKLLLEACLELAPSGLVVAMQDLGAAGLTSSSVELAARGGCGIILDVTSVSRRESGMTAYDVMLSESQERMLLVALQGAEADVQRHFARWGLQADVVGTITDDGQIRVVEDGAEVASLPVSLLTDEVPAYVREVLRPESVDGGSWTVGGRAESAVHGPASTVDLSAALLRLLGSPNLCSRAYVYHQYDHTVQARTVVPPGMGAAVLRLEGTSKALAVTTDCNGGYCAADPRRGAQIAVAEAARNLACRGAEPIAVTDCLNFGSPERPEVYWQLSEAVDGLAEACRALQVPIVSGNVSLYNETSGKPIIPTPVVGMVGLLEDVSRIVPSGFTHPDQVVYLLGPLEAEARRSEYAAVIHGLEGGPAPSLDLGLERRLHDLLRRLAERRLLAGAQDCSEGGLAVALAESTLAEGVGFRGESRALDELARRASGRTDLALFAEMQSRCVVACDRADVAEVERLAAESNVPHLRLGETGGDMLDWGACLHLSLADMRHEWESTFERRVGGSDR